MKNLFNRFRDANGRSARTVGTCISIDVDGCTIQYPSGALIRAKGAAVVGQRYFVLAGRIDGDAPTLPGLSIEV